MKINLLTIFILSCAHLTAFAAGQANNQQGKVKLAKIIDSKECSEDVRRLCSHIRKLDDISILSCLQDNKEVMQAISSSCQHFLWSYKRSFTLSEFLNTITSKKCSSSLDKIEECKTVQTGHRVPCLLDHKTEVVDKSCHKFLNKVGVVVFSDYNLIYKFVDRCQMDIEKLQCGRIHSKGDSSETSSSEELKGNLSEEVTSQVNTVDCLINEIKAVSKGCKHEILRLSELQSDDYHLNRKLYMECREDRERLCSNVHAGEGRVYSCLMKHKFSDQMSKGCQNQLLKKQQMESMDAKADYTLFSNCKADIEKYQCIEKTGSGQDILQMSTVLLCLEDAETRGEKVDSNCKAELTQRRLEMIEDFHVSPEVVVACIDDVKKYCDNTDKQPSAALHCLLRLATPDGTHPKGKLKAECKIALTQLVKIANPTEDLMYLDPAVRESCASSFSHLCSNVESKKQAFHCLVENMASPEMTPECHGNLTSILYFISLDFTVDDAVARACHKDAVKLCEGPKTYEETIKRTPNEKMAEYFCMYKKYRDDRIQLDLNSAQGIPDSISNRILSAECSNEMFQLIKAQASQIQIDPIVFDKCFVDLGQFCNKPHHKGHEHECLQENMEKLQSDCQAAVVEFSKMEDADIRLDRQVAEACDPMVQIFCSKEPKEEVLKCLINHKRHSDMIPSCQAVIEHIQIVSLEEYRIDHRFAKFCEKEITKHCSTEIEKASKNGKQLVSKTLIVSCLSKVVIGKLMEGDKHPLSKMCRRQFSFELLQRSDTITLDHNLLKDCHNDTNTFCKDESLDKVATCLRQHQDKLEVQCHKRIFQRERLESLDANFDGRLRRVCSQMIDEFCPEVSGTKLFQCLHRQMKSVEFDEDCRQLIYLRLERRMNDIRLNPDLMRDCKKEIVTYCGINNIKTENPKRIEFEGQVINCLKETFSNNSHVMQPSCRQRILKIIIEANAHLRLDPILRKKCKATIEALCKDELNNELDVSSNGVYNCLKHKFLKKEISLPDCEHEIYRLLKEGRADVHVDFQLFSVCEEAIMKLCHSEDFGEGRKMSCLLYLASDKEKSSLLGARCLKMIREREEMWSYAAKFQPESIGEFMMQVNQSSMRTYLFSMFGLMIFALIVLGICCGRITKRVPVDLKNK